MELTRKEIYEKIANKEISVEEGMELLKRIKNLSVQPEEIAGKTGIKDEETEDFAKRIENYFSKKVAAILNISNTDVVTDENFMNMGVDSVKFISLSNEVEEELGVEFVPTFFFEHQNIMELSLYLAKNYEAEFRKLFGIEDVHVDPYVRKKEKSNVKLRTRKKTIKRQKPQKKHKEHDIAVIGMAGRFARSRNLDEFWKNINEQNNLITEVPEDRWDVDQWFDTDRDADHKTYSKWGSFIDDIDKFDPAFFGISPKEAIWLDPQLRLLLEVIYETVEDAGYAHKIQGTNTGLFTGICFHEYWDEILRTHVPFSDYQYLSNCISFLTGRISYTFDLQGHSIPIDNACASSLTALHLAYRSLQTGENEMAFAAGVNLLISPLHYVSFSRIQALSPTGHCYTFDKKADGYVPGEGVVSLLLKPLHKALQDNDNIHAIIKGSAINHVGKSNNPTSPRPELQTELIIKAINDADIDPDTISYLEAHGTGTILGDPVEITGVKNAFKQLTDKKKFCAVGSVKAHIGHLEGAAGLTSVVKVILMMQHKQIPAMPYFEELNPYIKLEDSPFFINKDPMEWKIENGIPRRAGVSSFGLSGNNSHVIIEGYEQKPVPEENDYVKVFLLSAHTEKGLKDYAGKFYNYLMSGKEFLGNILFTLQTGREYFRQRLAIVCNGRKDLLTKLKEYIDNKQHPDVFYDIYHDTEKKSRAVSYSMDDGKIIAQAWVKGSDIEWEKLYTNRSFRKISLPTYPFETKRFWFTDHIPDETATQTEKICVKKDSPVYFKPGWKKAGHAFGECKTVSISLLLFDVNNDLYTIFKKENRQVILVLPGKKFTKDENGIYTINPETHDDYKTLVKTLIHDACFPETIVYLWSSGDTAEFDYTQYAKYLNQGIYSVYFFIKAIAEQHANYTGRIFYLYKGDQNTGNPGYAAIAGYSSSLQQVLPGIDFSTVRIREKDFNLSGLEDYIEKLVSNTTITPGNIYLENNDLYIKTMQPVEIKQSKERLFKENGVYLITGGLGALGIFFARHIIRTCHATIILTGRSAFDDRKETIIKELSQQDSNIRYIQSDVSKPEDITVVKKIIHSDYKKIDGIIHAAGSISPHTIMESDFEDFQNSLYAKIQGTVELDHAFADENLEFFILFSSVSAFLGDFGQCSYSIGNNFLDNYCQYRESLREKGIRKGKTISILWSLWEKGGMHINEESEKLYLQSAGLSYLKEKEGIEGFTHIINSDYSIAGLFVGNKEKITRFLNPERVKSQSKSTKMTSGNIQKRTAKVALNSDELNNCVKNDLKAIVAELLYLQENEVDETRNLGDFGFDSLSLKDFSVKISKKYNITITPSVFFAHSTINALTGFLTESYTDDVAAFYTLSDTAVQEEVYGEEEKPYEEITYPGKAGELKGTGDIAIIGISGIFPQSKDLNEFWKHLENQDNLITEIPKERWDWREYYGDPVKDGDKTRSKWGGFISDVDKFDPLFFNISPGEAEVIDPQHRLFLEVVWKTFEDAGYKVSDFAGKSVGVFVGAQFNDYYRICKNAGISSSRLEIGNSHAVLANRISFLFNFHGPSEAIDTACSSGLVAFHRAVKSIQNGESELAIAGGVSLMLTPDTMIGASKMGIISPDGRCRTFDKGANGYVKGEGIGAFLLKPLQQAIDDHDTIYAVVKGTAVNHGGTAHSLTAPNSEAQAALIVNACEDGNIDPETITYIETHGTGTELGDPVEIEGLKKAFSQLGKQWKNENRRYNYCGLGSVKTNVGHLEPAAGTVGLMKVILALQNKKLPGLVNFKEKNPYLEIDESSFYIVDKTREWVRLKDEKGNDIPRRAGVSAFGFGGTNAHVIVEEPPEMHREHDLSKEEKYIIPLSAKNSKILKKYVDELKRYLKANREQIVLENIAYTLQTGREIFNERVIFFISSMDELFNSMEAFLSDTSMEGRIYYGTIKKQEKKDVTQEQINEYVKVKNYKELAGLWVNGIDIDWNTLYTIKPLKICLPGYPFDKKRYWIDMEDKSTQTQKEVQRLHPLIFSNISTLKEQKFKAVLSEKDFFIKDHVISGQMVFPGVAYLEMARAAAELALEDKIGGFSNVVWSQPVVVEKTKEIFINIYPGRDIHFKIYSNDKDKIRHCQGIILLKHTAETTQMEKIGIDEIKKRCKKKEGSGECYQRLLQQGFSYGEGLKSIKELYYNEKEVLAFIDIPGSGKVAFKDFVLHPALLIAAVQSSIGFSLALHREDKYISIPYALKELEILNPLTDPCFIYSTIDDFGLKQNSEENKINILLLDKNGQIFANFKEFIFRQYKQQKKEMKVNNPLQDEINILIEKVLKEEMSPLEAAHTLEEIYE
ncbi:MAG: SDR family NAD(P)-dependent oxidoreductase [Spirochaetales bacterium]|nr:SDR family NAD(P)-dependent oxidoreductase [Spirochaetales bacterium]